MKLIVYQCYFIFFVLFTSCNLSTSQKEDINGIIDDAKNEIGLEQIQINYCDWCGKELINYEWDIIKNSRENSEIGFDLVKKKYNNENKENTNSLNNDTSLLSRFCTIKCACDFFACSQIKFINHNDSYFDGNKMELKPVLDSINYFPIKIKGKKKQE